MTARLIVLLALLVGAGGTSALQVTPVLSAPAASPAAAADPATLLFPPDVTGLVLVVVKADRAADYEALIQALHVALADAGPAGQRAGAGWKVYKAQEADAKGNAIYVHQIAAPQPDIDYRPSVVIESVAKTLPEALLAKYRDAFAAPPTRLSLGVLADFAATPIKPKP